MTDPTAMFDLLDGLVPLHALRLQTVPGALERAHARAGDLADALAESGDRLTAPGNFPGRDEHRKRGDALSATAAVLALGALQEGGVTWAGRHWCTAAHPDCPNRRH